MIFVESSKQAYLIDSICSWLIYIKDMGMTPDKETISKYSEKAAKKFFHIPS